jgi:hypothetical protein
MAKQSGRRPAKGKSMTREQAAAVIGTLRDLQENDPDLTLEGILNALSDYYSEHYKPESTIFHLEEDDFHPNNATISKIVNGKVGHNSTVMKAIYLWLFHKYPYIIDKKQYGEELKREEREMLAVKSIIGYNEPLDRADIKRWSGDYVLYRPFHLDPLNRVQACLLTIGAKTNDFACRIESKFSDKPGRNRNNIAKGKFVPCGYDKAYALLLLNKGYSEGIPHSTPAAGHYALHINQRAEVLDAPYGPVLDMSGIMVAAIGNVPSAWPFFVRRLESVESFTPHVLSAEEYMDLDEEIQAQLDLGAVHWQPKNARKTLMKSYKAAAEGKSNTPSHPAPAPAP